MDDYSYVNALKSALRKHKTPGIFNTDQGAQYTGKALTGALKDHGVQISMDGKGRCMDNIFIERLWRSVKYEKIFLEEFETVPELRSGLKEYFEFYNFERPHQSLVGKTPAEVYWEEKLPRRQREKYNEKQTKVHLNSREKLSLTWGAVQSNQY